MRKVLIVFAALCVLHGTSAQASAPLLEVNGRVCDGAIFIDRGDVYAALEVVGPLLMGPQFRLDNFDFILRRCTFTFVAAGSTAPSRVAVLGCVKRGPDVYVPLKHLMQVIGGSLMVSSSAVRLSYPVGANPAPGPAAIAPPAPGPAAVAMPVPGPAAVASPAPTPVAIPTPAPIQAAIPTPRTAAQPSMSQGEPASSATVFAEVRTANQSALNPTGLIKRLEIYHPGLPEPSDVIPNTEVAGLKVYVKKLLSSDTVDLQMWAGRRPGGEPAFKTRLSRFRGNDLEESSFFVRLPLTLAAGWHTVRLEYNQTESVEYHFVTY